MGQCPLVGVESYKSTTGRTNYNAVSWCRVSATKNGGPGVVRAVRTDGELPQPDGAEHDQLGGGVFESTIGGRRTSGKSEDRGERETADKDEGKEKFWGKGKTRSDVYQS